MNELKTNLIYIFADQWRKQAIGFMNEDPVKTPNIDQFAKESVVCSEAISTFPLCTPHRGSLLTGRYPLTLGLDTNCRLGYKMELRADEVSIAHVLKDQGYQTGYIGKWHLDEPDQNKEENPISGAKHWDAYTPPGPKRQGFDFWYSYGADDKHLHPHYWRDTPKKIEANKWSVEHETDVALDYIENRDQNSPFVLFVSWNPPHTPFEQVPDKYMALYDKESPERENVKADKIQSPKEREEFNLRKQYYAAVTGIDEQFGRIINYLREHGLEENTLIVLSSDHGEMMGSHGYMHKHVWYEESIGIPLIMRWKGGLKPSINKTVIGSVDHMPTLLGLLGVKVPETVEGTDYSDALVNEQNLIEKDAFICAYTGSDKERILGIPLYSSGWRGVRNNRYTYIVSRGYNVGDPVQRLLYDNSEDPYQLNPQNIDQDEYDEEVVASLQHRLKVYLDKIKDPFKI